MAAVRGGGPGAGRADAWRGRRAGVIFLVAWLLLGSTEGGEPPAPAAKIEDFAPPEEFVMAGGVKTHFVTRGRSGVPIVLVHGFASSTYSWDGNIEALARTHRVYALDLKGFGLTAKPRDGEYHFAEYARHLLAFLDVMKLQKPVLVGHSMGGAVVTRLALLHPERVAALVLIDPAPVTFPGADRARPGKPTKPGGAAVPGDNGLSSRLVSAVFRATVTRERVEAGLKSAFHDPSKVTREMVDRTYRPFTIEGSPEALAAMTLNANRDEPGLPPVTSLMMPVLLVWGRHDRVVPLALFEYYARSIPGARTAMFEQSGHIPHEEEPERFNTRLLEFLDAPPAPRTTPISR